MITAGVLRGEDLATFDWYCEGQVDARPLEVEWYLLGGMAKTTIFRFRCGRCGLIHQQSVEMVVERMERAWAKGQTNGQSRRVAWVRAGVRGQGLR